MKQFRKIIIPLLCLALGSAQTAYAAAPGPGLSNLAPSDEYASHQWALKNDGRIRRTQSQLDLTTLDYIYVHQNEHGGVDGIKLPPLGPSNYKQISTEAVEGIDINIEPAWQAYENTAEKRSVIVAVIDTGIDITHPDLEHSIWNNADEIPDDGIDNDGNGYVDDVNGWNFFSNNNQVYVGSEDSHGTHAAGTIAATRGNGGMAGITDNQYVKIMPLKALGTEEGKGESQAILDAIHYAEANGASICNLSFGSNHHEEAIAQAIRDSSMLFVVAAGNGDSMEIGYDIDRYPVFPASLDYDNIISVGNLLFNGTLDESSNYGAQNVDIAAPGTYILSTVADHNYGYMSGTSMSAPMVTGAAAMVYSAHPDYTLADVKAALLNSAHRLDSLSGKVLSGGMLDVGAAMVWQR